MFRLTILLAYLSSGQTMTDITKHLLTPLAEEGEACGYRSCHISIEGQLNIHVIPHTHAELGYTKTFEQHFTGRDEFFDKSNINMKRILDYVISELWAKKDRKFTFSDLPYLYKWWSIRDETVHRMVYQLIRQGRLHIVGGGWSMTDESTATYQPIIDHFTYSLRKLNATFLECTRPYVTWQADVFGHTSEFASLMAQMGFDAHFINPISYDDELERMRTKRMEFVWRGSPDLGVSSEIFTHKLFDGYWSPPGFCFGGQCGDPLIVNSNSAFDNVNERVKLFVEAMQYRQSPHYATNHLIVMMGQRMGYYDAPLWFQNIEKLMQAINAYSATNNLNMFMYYSTPACYLRAIHGTNASFAVETDDFVPIAYDQYTHFSGIFTSRPTVKYAAREGNLYLQITKQLQVLARLKNNDNFFEDFHWIVGVFQDHNVLTGGMRPFVRDYYVNKIYNVLKWSQIIVGDSFVNLMKTPRIRYHRCLFNISYCEYTDQDNYHIVIYNPLAWNVTIPVRLPVKGGRYLVSLPNLERVRSVVMKIPACIRAIPFNRTKKYDFELVFIAENVPALGYRSYFIERSTRMRRSVDSDDKFANIREKNDKFSHLDDRLINYRVKTDEISHPDDFFSNDGVNNDEFDDTDDHLEIDREKNYEIVQLHDVTIFMNNVSRKIESIPVNSDLYIIKKPNITKTIVFDKNNKPNNDLKRIFDSTNDEGDNVELDIVFESARKKHNTMNNNSTLNLNTPSKVLNTHYWESNVKYNNNVTEHDLYSINEYTTTKPNNNIENNDSDNSNKALVAETDIDTKKYIKNKNRNILKGLKRCNCKTGRLKRENIKKHSEEYSNDTIDQTFGNKTLKFIHLNLDNLTKIDDETTQKQDVTKAFKRETLDLKKDENDKIKDFEQETQQPKSEIKDVKELKLINPKQEEIKNFKREAKKIQILSKTNTSHETRLERSLIKKIKNAKKKYLRRQTNNLKIDDDSLLSNDRHYDDDYSNEDIENSTDVNDRYVFEHVTDYSEYVVTPRTTDGLLKPTKFTIRNTTTTTKRTTTQKTTTTSTTTTTTETSTTTKKPDPLVSVLYSDTTDTYISNEYVNITADIHKNITHIALSNGLNMKLNINFYYYASDDPIKLDRPEQKKPGAYVFRPMDPEPVFIAQKPKFEIYKSSIVEEIHSNSEFASYIIRLYKNTPYCEVEWILREIPISDDIGKEVFIRYNTDLETNGIFYTDANGRQTMKRVYGYRPNYTPAAPEAVAGNFYPVTSKITIEDPHRMIRFSVFNDRTQAGSSANGEIDLMLNRRLLTDDAGVQNFLNETENEIGTTVSGKHYIYITKLSTKINKIFEKKLAKEIGLKPQIFLPKKMVEKTEWENYRNEFVGVKKIPVGLNVLTLQEWNDGSFLLRIENYLEKSDVLRSGIKKVVLQDLFTVFRITRVRETTLAGNIFMEDFEPLSWKKSDGNTDRLESLQVVKVDEEILFKPQQIRTFIIWVEFHK